MHDALPPHHARIALPQLTLEAGGVVERPVASIWWWGGPEDTEALRSHGFVPEVPGEALQPVRRSAGTLAHVRGPGTSAWADRPTVLIVHALTGDRRAGGDGGWWSDVVGPGKALDPARMRLICINQLGSCYGSSGPGDEGFPTRDDATGGDGALPKGWPATVTTTDQARFLLNTLDSVGLSSLEGVVGGSVGGMIAQAIVALRPGCAQRLVSIASSMAASPWIIGWNHIARLELVRAWAGGEAERHHALEMARRLAHMTYRAEPGLEARQGRRHRPHEDGVWSSERPYAVQTYLDHQARKLRTRFLPEAYVTQIDAMDHHDLERVLADAGTAAAGWASHTTCVAIDTDALFLPHQSERMVRWLLDRGQSATLATLESLHGHDAFLIEHAAMDRILGQALNVPPLSPHPA